MKLYVISQDKNDDYYTFDSAVVAAANAEDARHIVPGRLQAWAAPQYVTVEYIGEAKPEITEETVIVASFNAG